MLIDGKKFDIKDIALMEAFIMEDLNKIRALNGTIEMYANDPDAKAGFQQQRFELRERVRITTALLTLVKG